MFVNQSLKLSNVYPSLFVDIDKLFGHLLRRHFVDSLFVYDTENPVVQRVRRHWRTQPRFDSAHYTERALCCRSPVALTCKASVVDEYEVSSHWSHSHCSLIITSQTVETLLTLVMGAGEFLLCIFRYTGSSWASEVSSCSCGSMISDSLATSVLLLILALSSRLAPYGRPM